jgi:ribose transport system substrate-binding protein
VRKTARRPLWRSAGVVIVTSVVLAACGGSSSPSGASSNSSAIHIAFFGFASDNSFTQAGWAGVQKAAKQYGATAQFFNGNFNGATQDSQMQEAITSKNYNVFIVEAYDSTSIVPYVTQAIAAGITVVAEYSPIGSDYTTDAPQIPGELSLVDVPTHNGDVLAQMTVAACGSLSPCQVAFLVGNPTSPLDVARTNEVYKDLGQNSAIDIVAKPVAGYTQAMGSSVAETLLAAHPNVNVIVGSSQAIEGVQTVLQAKGLLSKIKLVGNGGSTQAVQAVQSGKWFGTYFEDEPLNSFTAVQYAIEKRQGKTVPDAVNSASLGPVGPSLGEGTAANLQGVSGSYSD